MSGKHDTVAQALADQLALIRIAAGFSTDIGEQVHRGKGKHTGSTYTVLFEGEEEVLEQKRGRLDADQSAAEISCKVRVPYIVEAQMPAADTLKPNVTGHAMADDICRALWPAVNPFPRTLLAERPAYAGRQILAREEGQVLVVVQVKLNATFVFNLIAP